MQALLVLSEGLPLLSFLFSILESGFVGAGAGKRSRKTTEPENNQGFCIGACTQSIFRIFHVPLKSFSWSFPTASRGLPPCSFLTTYLRAKFVGISGLRHGNLLVPFFVFEMSNNS